MFREATVWELRLGKIASFVFTGLFVFLLIRNVENFARDEWWHLAIDYGTYVAGFIFYSSILCSWLFFKNPQREARQNEARLKDEYGDFRYDIAAKCVSDHPYTIPTKS